MAGLAGRMNHKLRSSAASAPVEQERCAEPNPSLWVSALFAMGNFESTIYLDFQEDVLGHPMTPLSIGVA